MHRIPLTAALFALPALSLAGLPPFSGFYGKFGLVQAGLAEQRFLVVGVSLAVSVLTLFSMTKIWSNVFWGEDEQPAETLAPGGRQAMRATRLMTVATLGLVAVTVAIAVGAEPLYQLSTRAAEGLSDPSVYIDAVLGGGG
jgi:multicomponent Na+:H+ antiporter subunit D